MTGAALALVDPSPPAMAALHRIVAQRDALRPTFRDAWDAVDRAGWDLRLRWCEAALALQTINAGRSCHVAFYTLTARLGRRADLQPVASVGFAAAAICRRAGARAAQGVIEIAEAVHGTAGGDIDAVLDALVELAALRPEAVAHAVPALPAVLPAIGPSAYGEWLAAGHRAYATDKPRFLAYVALEDPLARERLADHGSAGALRRALPGAIGFATMLFGDRPVVRTVPCAARPSLATPIVVVPQAFPGVPAARQADLAAAALAHAGAHRAFGGLRFEPKRLKPIQVALTSLIEDARVEALAMARLPGLFRLWRPFHIATPDGARTVPDLMARMARALFDPAYGDPDPWIAKARGLFAAAQPWIAEPPISREIGQLLGNDLGQMRLSFNPRTYVVEPAYRDDHAVLWATEQPPAEQAAEIDVAVEAVRRREEERDEGQREPDQAPEDRPAGRARPASAGAEGTVIARLPEWDHAAALERHDWVTVKAYRMPRVDREPASPLPSALSRRVETLIRGTGLGLPRRLKRQAEGDQLDLDAAVAAIIAQRTGVAPDQRVYRRTDRRSRDVATLLLVDTSESTRDRLGGTARRIIDLEVEAAALLARAIDALGDALAIDGFASAGREDVRILPVKAFGERFGPDAAARLAGLEPGYSTRLGAALRHAGRRFAGVRAYRRVALVVTDGEPFDIDCDDPVYLAEDARRAARELRAGGVDAFGLGIGSATAAGPRIFGRGNFVPVARPDDLPKALAALYFRLSAR